MKSYLKQHFSVAELKSMGYSFLAVFLPFFYVDAVSPLAQLTLGNLSKAGALALLGAALRSTIKALFNLLGAYLQSKNLPTPPNPPVQA